MNALDIPVQIARCACKDEDEWRPCNGEFYSCEACGEDSDEPMPYAEPMDDVPGRDFTSPDSWFWYCQSCAFEWILVGADVRRVTEAA